MSHQFNSHLHNPNNQLHSNNGANASAPNQAMGIQGNLGQIPPQFQAGVMNNPQLSMPPFTNPNPFFPPNQLFPFPQGAFQNLNANNLPQPFAQNGLNPAQFMPTWQLNMPNFVQNVAQLLQMQMMNAGPQNLGLFMNAQPGGGSNNGALPQQVNGNGLTHMKRNDAVTTDVGYNHAQRNAFPHCAANSQKNAEVVNDMNDRKNNWRKSHDKNFAGNHKHNESQRGFANKQFHNRQSAQGNFKFNNENRGRGNKNYGGKNTNLSNLSEQIQVGKKRSLALNYTEQEIQQWREQRRKNFPSQANTEKKLKTNPKQPEVVDEAAKIRRQQLKEILAKQAELGFEVAEIPSCYLSDSEQHKDQDGTKRNNKVFGKRDRFQNKFDKRGKFQRGDRFSKRQSYENNNSTNMQNRTAGLGKNYTENKKEPSLLKKLLDPEIKKDKKHLVQVFRFMVANKFFENWPEKPLKFPEVIIKESDDGSEIVKKVDLIEGDTWNGLSTLETDIVSNGGYNESCSVKADEVEEEEEDEEEEEGEIL